MSFLLVRFLKSNSHDFPVILEVLPWVESQNTAEHNNRIILSSMKTKKGALVDRRKANRFRLSIASDHVGKPDSDHEFFAVAALRMSQSREMMEVSLPECFVDFLVSGVW